MQFSEKPLNKEYIFKGKILSVRCDDVILGDGSTAIREVVEHSGGSCILCEKNDKILLVKQFRYGAKQELLELPAGKLEKGEDPKLTAIRELQEECGIITSDAQLLFKFYPTPAYDEEIIYIYKATDMCECEKKLDDGEFLSAEWIEKDRLKEMIRNGEIKDAKTLIALLSVL